MHNTVCGTFCIAAGAVRYGKQDGAHAVGNGSGAAASAVLPSRAGVQKHKRAKFAPNLEEERFFWKESSVQALYTAEELDQHAVNGDGSAHNHPGTADQANSPQHNEPQDAAYANEMPGPGQAPCLHGMLKMSTPAPHAWVSPATLAANGKSSKKWRVCAVHAYPTHTSLFEQVRLVGAT